MEPYGIIPGIKGKEFNIKFKVEHLSKGEFITPTFQEVKIKVVKVYSRTIYRNLLTRLGFKTKILKIRIL